ncbi:MAG: M48 family metallopeptidase [Chlorobiaceae bacterium]|nr:M48 family metallopeptidase [Chlorobiaceae bacterium]NTV15996.1 M48 family metallopeptidase [Chlorobiaceae bacterium]
MPLSLFTHHAAPKGSIHFSYTLKVSLRAKFARLKITPHGGLVVVVPPGFNKKNIASLLLHHEQWIKKVTAKFDAQRHVTLPLSENGLPLSVCFPDFAESWTVIYTDTGSAGVELIEQQGNTLSLTGDVADTALSRRLLCSWLKQRAQAHLLSALEKLAAAHGFSYASSGIRLQHSRWGSCSSRRSISLNSKLLFLPEHLVRYIMVHELCHTVHMNHSRSFWSLVHEHDPLFRSNNLEMKSAWKYVPQWVSAQP